MPLCKPGIAIGSIFVVTLVMGDFITVRLMSGGQSASVGLMIANQISLLQYPAACANAVVLLAVGAADGRAPSCASSISARSCDMPGRFGRAVLGLFFVLFVLFLYGPTLTILILSFQGPDGGLTFPMNGVSCTGSRDLFEPQPVGDFGGVTDALAAAGGDGDGGDGGDFHQRPGWRSAAASAAPARCSRSPWRA